MSHTLSQTRYLLPQRIIALLISLALLILNTLRVLNISITHDETGYHTTEGYIDLMLNNIASANNHILHSLLRKFFVEIFTDSLFFLRLDSLLAQILFLLFLYKFLERLLSKWWLVIPAFLLVNTACPLLFEFWGLSRGYALAMAFTITSIYYLYAYITLCHLKLLMYSITVAILAVYSNFSYINCFVSLIGVVLIHRLLLYNYLNGKPTILHELIVIGIGSLLLAGLIYVPLTNVLGNGELAYLGNNGFIKDTVTSLVKDGILLSTRDSGTIDFMIYAVITLFWAAGIYWIVVYLKAVKQSKEVLVSLRFGIVLYLLLAISVVSVVVQFTLFGINYLIDRTALFFVLLFVLHFIYWLHYISINTPILGSIFLWILLWPAIDNFSKSEFNTHQTRLWWYCADDMAILKHIANAPENQGKQVKLWVEWAHLPSFKYNISKFYKDHFYPITDHHLGVIKDTSYDYYFVAISSVGDVPPGYKHDTEVVNGGFILFRKDTASRGRVSFTN